MKRLIALLAGLAVMGSMTVTSFAAFTDEIVLNEDGATYTAALSDEAATANAGKQTTIVAYKGNAIEVGSIQYIDQAAANSFTFQLKDELTEDVKVVMGGEAIDKQEIGTIKFATEDPTFTVSGSVNNYVEEDFYTMLIDDELVAEEDLDTYKVAYGTTAYLTTVDAGLEFAENYGDEFAIDAIAEAAVVDGVFTFEGVEAGDYVIVIAREAALPYIDYLTVEENVELDAIDMLFGDLVGAKDYLIDSGDVSLILEAAGPDITEDGFVAGYDVAHDCILDSSDISVVLENNGLDIYAYDTDFINENL